MNYEDFLKKIKEYYGGFPDKSKIESYVLGYLKRDIDENKLAQLFRYVTYSHPPRFGAPGISEIETAIYSALKLNKGADVHKANFKTTSEIIEPETEEESFYGKKILEESGGLTGMVEKLVKAKRFKKKEKKIKGEVE